MDYTETAPKVYTVRKAPTKTIHVEDGDRVAKREAKRQLKQTIRHHKLAIKAELRKVKTHKLLIKQAKTTYKVKQIGA